MKIQIMDEKRKAMSVHLFTATGAVFAMLALLAAANEEFTLMFWWLIVAFIVDGLDGPLARKFDVTANAPRYDGGVLDCIIDYMTYAFIPAFALYWSGILPDWLGLSAAGIIAFSSAIYLVDTNMKNTEYYFVGFPSCWNMIVLVIFVIHPNDWLIIASIIILAILMFFPLLFIHPIRTKRWRPLSSVMIVVWIAAAASCVSEINTSLSRQSFSPELDESLLLLTSAYLLCVGIIHQLFPRKKTDAEKG